MQVILATEIVENSQAGGVEWRALKSRVKILESKKWPEGQEKKSVNESQGRKEFQSSYDILTCYEKLREKGQKGVDNIAIKKYYGEHRESIWRISMAKKKGTLQFTEV